MESIFESFISPQIHVLLLRPNQTVIPMFLQSFILHLFLLETCVFPIPSFFLFTWFKETLKVNQNYFIMAF
jgi:hypothetical protein